MDTMDFHQETLVNINNDFDQDPNLDQFTNLIRWENKEGICNFNSEPINECFIDNSFLSHSHPPIPFDQCNSNSVNVYDPSSTLSSFSCFDGEAKGRGKEEEENDMGDSSATTTTTTTNSVQGKPSSKTDRSKTLVSERKRRDRMKEKLYALRSLVPIITKMDKASIVGDAVSYTHELQAQAKMLKAEVEALEETYLLMSKKDQGSIENPLKVQFTNNSRSICKKIIQMDIFQVDEKGFYVKIVCNKGEGVAASLYRSLESLTGFNVQNSNLETISDSFLLTFSLNLLVTDFVNDAKGSEPEINLPNLKLWVTEAFVNQGFEFIPFFYA
ncbi:Transcription factor FER-LIKE IRON DEFICIENCY-INDUCED TRANSCRIPTION FACTOR, partial [Mucuna pruriens]